MGKSHLVRMTKENKNKRLFNCFRCRDKNWLNGCGCGQCNKIIFLRNKRGREIRFAEGHNIIFLHNRGETSSHWKGGRCKCNGYWYLKIPGYVSSNTNGYVREHVYFYQEYHKCCMLDWGDVHHTDGNKDNNMPWNLQGMMKAEHTKLHQKKDVSGRVCLLCNSKETYVDRNGYKCWLRFNDGFICYKCNAKKYNRKKQSLKRSL